MKYLVTYDLKRPGQHYSDIVRTLTYLGQCIPIAQSVWLVKTSLSASQILNRLRYVTDANDILFVCQIGEWQSHNLSAETNQWLQS